LYALPQGQRQKTPVCTFAERHRKRDARQKEVMMSEKRKNFKQLPTFLWLNT
jgi:hypothetical protein